MSDQHLVVLGRLTRPHSIRGEIRVDYYADAPQLLEQPLQLRAGSTSRPVRVTAWRVWRDQLIVRLDGVDDRSAAELLRGQELLIDKALLPEPDPDEPYLHDIIGLPVLHAGTRAPIGVLEDVLYPAGQEVWSIRAPEGHEILFPAVPDFVDGIDTDEGRILVTPPPGLLELYATDEAEADQKPSPVRKPARSSALPPGSAGAPPATQA